MAPLPIELIPANQTIGTLLRRPLRLANDLQSAFAFSNCEDRDLIDAVRFAPAGELSTSLLLDEVQSLKYKGRGFHPFIIMFTDAYLRGKKLINLFGMSRAEKGVAIVTFHEVRDILGDTDDALTGYILYYLARYSMGFSSPSVKNHAGSCQCIYDTKVIKREIIDSFRAGAICDDCRKAIWKSGKGTTEQVDAVNVIIEHASSLVHKTRIARRPNVFVASSTKNIAHARALKVALGKEFDTSVWDEDQVFKLGGVTIEQLEEHVGHYDFGIFVMLPDDRIVRGDVEKMVPRDNVVFEAGLFTGKLSRNRALIVTTDESKVQLPSDLNGLTTLRIRLDQGLPGSLGSAAQRAASHMKYIFGECQDAQS